MIEDIGKMFEEDADAVQIPEADVLADIARLADKQLELEEYIERLQSRMDDASEQLRKIREQALPDAMAAANMKSFKLSDGSEIKIKDEVYASVRSKFMDGAVEWLMHNNLGGIIKNEVVVRFGREEIDSAKRLTDYLQGDKYIFTEKMSINPKTLQATVKEQRKRGLEFPEEYFSVFDSKRADIKRPKH